MSNASSIDSSVHLTLAKSLFDRVWELLETPSRTGAQDEEMVHASYASRYHWSQVGGVREFATGEWLISRVFGVLRISEPCNYHAQRALDHAEQGNLEPIFFGYANEAAARGHLIEGSTTEALRHIKVARGLAGEHPTSDWDRLLKDLDQLEHEIRARAE